MKKLPTICCFLAVSIIVISSCVFVPFSSLAQTVPRLVVRVNQGAFAPGDTLILYGKALPQDALFVKISDPANKTVRVDNIVVNNGTGAFLQALMEWPQPSKGLVYGTYTIEVSSSRVLNDKVTLQVTFGQTTPSGGTLQGPTGHFLAVKLDSPTEISAGKSFRIFVQVTYDGALVNTATDGELVSLLGSSHIHSGNATVNLSGKFVKLHEGIYYADVQLGEGSYIIHAIAFYKGLLAHDSKVVSSGASIGEVNQSISTLRTELNRTSEELNDTRTSVTKSVEDARMAIKSDVDQLQSASGQINSLILPILALISVIIALQISLFARIRASFK